MNAFAAPLRESPAQRPAEFNPGRGEYDQSCEVAEDCVAVIDGDTCCGCPYAAINEKDREAYDDALGECSAQCDIGCVDTEVQCNDGTCEVLQL